MSFFAGPTRDVPPNGASSPHAIAATHRHSIRARRFMNILWYEVFGVGFGLLMMWFYAKKRHWPSGTERFDVVDNGWPEIPAIGTATSIMGSALSFLLVFRLSWSFGRWWEARGLIGTAMTKMRNLASMITANSDAPTMDQAMALLELRLVCKLHVATMIDILVQEAAQSADQKRLRSSKSVRKLLQELDKDELRALGQERARLLARSDRRILLCHSWLAHAIRNCSDLGLLRNFEQQAALECQGTLLGCFYSSMKIKTTHVPSGIQTVTLIMRFAFCIILFPQFMAYNMVTKLNRRQEKMNLLWDKSNGFFVIWYLVLTAIVIAFFSVIHIVSLELDDPYGEDDSDLPLEKMTNSMWSDLDSINSTFIDNSRLGSGEGLKGLVRSKSKGNPTVVALRGSDLIRKSSPAAMAAAVYAQQQEDLKLPEEVKQRRFGEGGVGDHIGLIGDKATSGLVELGKITNVYGDDYASTSPSVMEKIAERERLKAMLADTFEAEEAPPVEPPTPPGEEQA